MRATRLVSLLLLLQMRGQLTAQELAGHFGVSVRTVHRDVESLAAAGVPVEAVRGPAGGYRLAGGYRTKLTGLTAAEAEALFVAPAPAAELGLGGVLANARLKVLAALPVELQERASKAERYFHLDTRRWFRAEDTVPHLPTIASATWHEQRLGARYREGRRVVRRTLDPLGLVLKGGAWYLVARRSAGMRVYRVSRFVSVRIRDEGFDRPEDFDLASYWEEWSRSFEASLPRVEVKLRASELALRHLPRDLQGGDGVFTVGFESLEEAFRELLKFGPDAEVLEPVELRERIASAAAEVADLYTRRRGGSLRGGRLPTSVGEDGRGGKAATTWKRRRKRRRRPRGPLGFAQVVRRRRRTPRQWSLRTRGVLGSFFVVPSRKEKHGGGRDEALSDERGGDRS